MTLALNNSGAINVSSSSATTTALEGDVIVRPVQGYTAVTNLRRQRSSRDGKPVFVYIGRHQATPMAKKVTAALHATSEKIDRSLVTALGTMSERIGTIGAQARTHVVLSAKKFRKSLAGIATRAAVGSRVIMKKVAAAHHALCRGLVYDVPPQLTPEQFAALGPTAQKLCKRHFAGMGLDPTTA